MKRLKNKVAIITGAGSGIGKETAYLYTVEGASVVCSDIHKEKADEVVRKIRLRGGNAISLNVDVSNPVSVKRMITQSIVNYKKLDILVNSAGILAYAKLEDTTEEKWDKVMNVNLKGTFLCSKYAVEQMIKQSTGGCIVNIASECGISGFPDLCAYCTSKAGVIMLTKAIAVELARLKIRVNCISPAKIYTPMHSNRVGPREDIKAKEIYKEMEDAIPIGRLGKPEDVAYAALFLASDEASYITGSNFSIDGGTTCSIVWNRYKDMLKNRALN